jgi:hypothetical protein
MKRPNNITPVGRVDPVPGGSYAAGRRRLRIIDLLSPFSYAVVVTVTLLMTGIDNPVGWASTYTYFKSITPGIGGAYLFAFVGVQVAGRLFARSTRRKEVGNFPGESSTLKISVRIAWQLFWIAAGFQIAKFVNIGSIPLFGSPLDRYKLTLGGFEDYPSRLLAPLATVIFCHGIVTRRVTSVQWVSVCAAALLNLFMTQRQEVANLLLGCGLVWAFNKRAKWGQIIGLLLAVFILAYVVIGLGAIARYGGASAISTKVSPIELPVWIVHAELTVPYVFGEHVVAALNGNFLYGLYTFGEFIAIFSPVKILHGASLMQSLYTNADTAQSVGAPYSYFIDFGYPGLILVGVFNSMVMSTFYRCAKLGNASSYWLTSYATVLISALWSIRSGISLIYPLVIYILLALFCATTGGGRMLTQIRLCAKTAFIGSLGISLMALLFRH